MLACKWKRPDSQSGRYPNLELLGAHPDGNIGVCPMQALDGNPFIRKAFKKRGLEGIQKVLVWVSPAGNYLWHLCSSFCPASQGISFDA